MTEAVREQEKSPEAKRLPPKSGLEILKSVVGSPKAEWTQFDAEGGGVFTYGLVGEHEIEGGFRAYDIFLKPMSNGAEISNRADFLKHFGAEDYSPPKNFRRSFFRDPVGALKHFGRTEGEEFVLLHFVRDDDEDYFGFPSRPAFYKIPKKNLMPEVLHLDEGRVTFQRRAEFLLSCPTAHFSWPRARWQKYEFTVDSIRGITCPGLSLEIGQGCPFLLGELRKLEDPDEILAVAQELKSLKIFEDRLKAEEDAVRELLRYWRNLH